MVMMMMMIALNYGDVITVMMMTSQKTVDKLHRSNGISFCPVKETRWTDIKLKACLKREDHYHNHGGPTIIICAGRQERRNQ